MNRWFVSDHHLWHDNIIRFCKRPFSNVKEMNEALLTYHNAVVKPEDHVSFLGDVTLMRGGRQERELFINEVRKYNGHKRLYLGNHDHWPMKVYLDAGFEKIYATWRDQQGVLFSHVAIHPSSMGTATANVHGHIHNNQSGKFEPVIQIDKLANKIVYAPYINISVEVINYTPVHYDALTAMIAAARGEYHGSKVGPEVARGTPKGDSKCSNGC